MINVLWHDMIFTIMIHVMLHNFNSSNLFMHKNTNILSMAEGYKGEGAISFEKKTPYIDTNLIESLWYI